MFNFESHKREVLKSVDALIENKLQKLRNEHFFSVDERIETKLDQNRKEQLI